MKYSPFSVIIKVNIKIWIKSSRKKVLSVISTENNKALEEVQNEKLEIQELNKKIKNLDNNPKFKESLAEALISKIATDSVASKFYDYYKFEVTKHNGLCREFLEKSRTMSDEEKDLFWSLIASIIKLTHTMYNEDYEETIDLYLEPDKSGGIKYESHEKFVCSWIYENINEIFSKDELDFIAPYFAYDSGDGIRNLISEIENEVIVEYIINEPSSFFGFLNRLFTDVYIYSQKNEVDELLFSDKKGSVKFNFENLAPIGFADFIYFQRLPEDKVENNLTKSKKYRLLFGKYFRFIISNIRYPDCGGDEETRAKLKERFLSDPNLKEFLNDELENHTKNILNQNKYKFYPLSS